jgi:hypothetical protein
MATNFPASLDSLTNPTSSDSLNSPSHSAQHANSNDAIEALQAKVGADSSAVTTSHDYKIADHASRLTTLENATNGGLVPLATSTFSAVSSVDIDDVFSADYTNYKITVRILTQSASATWTTQLRSGGTTITANYNTNRLYSYGSNVAGGENPSGTDDWYMGSPHNAYNDKHAFEMTLLNPYTTDVKVGFAHGTYRDSSYHVSFSNGYYINNSSLCDGLRMAVSTGTFGGTMNIYGLVDPS